MNTKFKLDKRVLPTLYVLLTAMWLPLTTIAQDLPKTVEHAQSMHDSADFRNCQRKAESLAFLPASRPGVDVQEAGFAETDPARQFASETLAVSQPSDVRIQQTFAGFGETDPAYQRSLYGTAVADTSTERMRQVLVGFAETDPADNSYRPGEDFQNHHLVVCPRDNIESVVYGMPGFPCPVGERYCYNHG